MLTTVAAGPHSVRGISVGGVYTSLAVPELGVVFDAGASPRSSCAIDTILLSHGHADHVGALPAMLGIRALSGKTRPPRVVMPAEILDDLTAALAAMSRLQRFPLEIDAIGMLPGDEIALRGDLRVRAVRTFHPVPSLAYLIVRRVSKLRADLHGLTGPQIAARRRAGEDVSDHEDRLELAYATDTLVSVLDHAPELLQARTLIVECTFLDGRKSLEAARAGCHIHLDEIIERAGRFANEHVVMMHFSQLYRPDEIAGILDVRLPPELRKKVIPFIPAGSHLAGLISPMTKRRDHRGGPDDLDADLITEPTGGPDDHVAPITSELDLHHFLPQECADVVAEYLRAAQETGLLHVRIIHGKGTGTLRRIVHGVLDRHPAVRAYQLASDRGGWGATSVELHPPVP